METERGDGGSGDEVVEEYILQLHVLPLTDGLQP